MSGSLWVILAYAAGLIALGAWIGRRVDAAGSFFVADRKLGPVLLFSTILAANVGAGTTVGAAGLAYRDGLSAWWWVGSAGIGTILLAIWVGPRIWQVAARHGLLTMGDYLELRYGRSVRLLIAGLLWFATLTIVSGQLIAMAEIVSVVAGSPRWVGALIGGAVVIAYFSAGGLVASAWVNLVQLVVILAGFAIAIPWALADIGGWAAVEAAAARTSPDYLSLWQGGASGWVYIALLAPAFIISPGLVQKVYGAASPRAIRTGLLAAGVALVLFAFAPTLLGMIARVYDPALASREQALPMLLATALPPALGLLGMAAVFSAEVSSADAGLFMLSTSLSKDLYKGFLRPEATSGQVLRVARGAAIAGGSLAVLLALWLESVIASLTIFYAILSVSLFVPVAAGLHSRRAGVPEALAAIGAGLAALAAVRIFAPADAPALLDPTLIGLIVSAAVFGLVAFARGRRKDA
ncbi:sodium:solute symporter family protein [Candidatus Palauibacter sp.]|uniref:sodium:solute symporter family protein n=1 Tax=Candidatus Palauibacter sp. TaxID=3101350 RepID=UPI003B01F300